MKDESEIRVYSESLTRAYQSISSCIPDETPAGCIIIEFKEMIWSYISDAAAFRDRNDPVNEYASHTYAHGWLDTGIFLGYFTTSTPDLCLPGDFRIPVEQHDKLKEKTLRYERMLRDALGSVEPAPESGSPYHGAALWILRIAEDAYILTKNQHHPGTIYTA
ncbi:MAG: hypothetical protein CVV33_09735, partial [Methanomicrobiales archaeon HGW-Methanomicrobiales-4]